MTISATDGRPSVAPLTPEALHSWVGRSGNVTGRFIDTTSVEWRAQLDAADHDFSHLPAITDLSGREEDGQSAGFFAEGDGGRLLIPLILRPVHHGVFRTPTPYRDATSAYGYPSPLLHLDSTAPSRFVERALETFVTGLREHGIVAAFVRLHPLLDLPLKALERVGMVVDHGDTVSVDLSLTDDEIWTQTSGFHRGSIRRAERLGYTATMDDDWQHFDVFVEIYRETMDRVSAASSYRFSRDYFVDLRDALGDGAHLCVVELKDKIAAAGLVTEEGGIVQMFLGGSRRQFLKHSPAKVMENFIRYWAKSRGNRWYHLGGGVGAARDSLFEFKAGFSPVTHPYRTWRVIADEAVYDRLVREWEAVAEVKADGPRGFFPAYRKPVPEPIRT